MESAIAKVNALISILLYTADEINHKNSYSVCAIFLCCTKAYCNMVSVVPRMD